MNSFAPISSKIKLSGDDIEHSYICDDIEQTLCWTCAAEQFNTFTPLKHPLDKLRKPLLVFILICYAMFKLKQHIYVIKQYFSVCLYMCVCVYVRAAF